MSGLGPVSLVGCRTYSRDEVNEAVGRAVTLLGGMERFVRPGSSVLIKPNLLTGKDPDGAVTTHPEVVRAVLRLVKSAGAGRVSIGDSNALMTFKKVCELTGMTDIAREEGVELVELSEVVTVPGTGVFKSFELSKAARDADFVINIAKAKTHGQMLLTLAVKNLFGCIPGRRKAQWHFKAGVDRHAFATMLVELYGLIGPSLNVVDAVMGMEGNGPNSGTPLHMGLIAAGAEGPLVDMVLSDVMGVGHDMLPTTRAAREKGLVPPDCSEIELLGDFLRPSDAAVKVKLPSTSSLEWSIPEPVRKVLKDYLTTKPRIDAKKCEMCLVCKTACPADAITREGGRLIIDYRRCIRCFCCQELCPIGAIDVVGGVLLKIMG